MSASIEQKHLAPVFPLIAAVQSSSQREPGSELVQPTTPSDPHVQSQALMPAHATIKAAVHANMIRSLLNVRKKATDITELAALIRTQGLLQILVGFEQQIDGRETGIVEIVAGGRRLEALGTLIEEGTIPADFGIPYLLVTEAEAIEISMAENRGRENMHPADVYEAMHALTERGRSIADIALSFNLDTLTIKRCLKLANVAPRLIELYRHDEANFEQMMALAISDSHAAQEHAWDTLSMHGRYPKDLRRLLTAQQIDVQADRLARFVGIDAFEKAGGVVVRDLFSDTGAGYTSDVSLLERMAIDKLERQRAKLLKEGYVWVEILPRADHGTLSDYGHVRTSLSELTADQCSHVSCIDSQLEDLQEKISAAEDNGGAEYDVLCAHAKNLQVERKSIYSSRTNVVDAGDKALAGAVVMLDNSGKVVVKRDLIRPADKVKMAKHVGTADKVHTSRRTKAVHSDRLTHILTSHRTAALQAELMDRPDIALVVLTHALLLKTLYPHRSTGLIAKVNLSQPTLAGETKGTLAATAFSARREDIVGRLSADVDCAGLLVWLTEQDQSVVLELMAFCVSSSLDATQTREGPCPAYSDLAGLLNLEMAKWWRATASGYFNHVSKDRTLAVIVQAVSREAAVPFEKMKKAEAAIEAERAVSSTSWLPEALRIN